MFSYTVSRGKMLVRWNERPIPRRQRSWGAMPVTSRSLNTTRPSSGSRCPVIRLNRVVLPAPLGPMIALIDPRGTVNETPPTAMKPPKFLESPRTSSTRGPPEETTPEPEYRAGQPAREDEQEDDQDGAQDQRPVLGVGDDLLVEPDEGQRAHRGAVEGPHAAQQGHDEHLGGLGPVGEVGEDAAVEDAEESPGQPGEDARQHEGGQLVASHVDPDELRPLRILADGREHAAEGRGDYPPQGPETEGDQDQAREVVVVRRAVAPQEGHRGDDPVEPVEARVGDLGHALLAAGHLVPLEADGPH